VVALQEVLARSARALETLAEAHAAGQRTSFAGPSGLILPGPYVCRDVVLHGFVATLAPGALRGRLPPAVRALPRSVVWVLHAGGRGFGHATVPAPPLAYQEISLWVPVLGPRGPAALPLVIFPDSPMAVACGREVFGLNKIPAAPALDEEAGVAVLRKSGRELVRVHWSPRVSRSCPLAKRLAPRLRLPTLTWKRSPAPDAAVSREGCLWRPGPYDVDALISLCFRVQALHALQSLAVSKLVLAPSLGLPLAGPPSWGFRAEMDFAMSPGFVLNDHRAGGPEPPLVAPRTEGWF